MSLLLSLYRIGLHLFCARLSPSWFGYYGTIAEREKEHYLCSIASLCFVLLWLSGNFCLHLGPPRPIPGKSLTGILIGIVLCNKTSVICTFLQ